MKKRVIIEKRNGEKELYDHNKLRGSLQRVGADESTINDILIKVDKILVPGIKTEKLFKFIHDELKKSSKGVCCRYNLKKAMIDLRIGGGYIYEKFIARILEKKGYAVKLNNVVKGKNITHEIDVVAKKHKEILMVEAKHHSKPWLGESIQTALYVYARFLDLDNKFTKPMLTTNTKFSPQVIKYSKGVGIKLMGWKYPKNDSLEKNIEKFGVYPISVLDLSKKQLDGYLEKDILTIDDLRKTDITPKMKIRIDEILAH